METEKAFHALYQIITRLRGRGGCPWDIEQTPQSMTSSLIEETYECLEAITEDDPEHVKEELGDLLYIAAMIAGMYQERNVFTVSDVLEAAGEKLVRRHPHVFAGKYVKDTAEVLYNWEKIKTEQEGRKPKNFSLDEIPSGLPPLDRAYKLRKKAIKAGLETPDINTLTENINFYLEKITGILKQQTECKPEKNELPESANQVKIMPDDVLGDLLFDITCLCCMLKTDPSEALLKANSKFVSRIRHPDRSSSQEGLAGQKN